MPATLHVETDWSKSFLPFIGDGVGYYKITDGNAHDESDFIIGGSGGLGIAPPDGDMSILVRDYTISRGRQSELDRVAAGTAVLTVDSPSALFSPLNTTGSLSGSLLPGRSVKIAWTLRPSDGGAASKFYRFTGKLKSISTEPDVSGQRNAVLTCIDDFNELQRVETRSTLYQNVLSGSLAGSLLSDAGYFASCRLIADGADNYRYAYFERRKLDEVLVDIERTEYGFMYINGEGAFVFHDRHYRSTTATVSASFDNTMAGISYYRSDDDLATSAEVPYKPKVQKASTTVWTLQSAIDVPARTTASFFGNYIDPTTCGLAPALGVASGTTSFFTASDGTGTNLSTDFSSSFVAFAESFKFAASNSGSQTGWLTAFTVTGCPLISYEGATAKAIDATACALYGLRTLVYGGQSLIHISAKARDFAQFLVNRFKDPANLDDVSMVVVNQNDTLWEQVLRRELDDRIAISNSPMNVNGADFFIGKINEQWSTAGIHSANWQLERATTQNDFIVDKSEVQGPDGLGY